MTARRVWTARSVPLCSHTPRWRPGDAPVRGSPPRPPGPWRWVQPPQDGRRLHPGPGESLPLTCATQPRPVRAAWGENPPPVSPEPSGEKSRPLSAPIRWASLARLSPLIQLAVRGLRRPARADAQGEEEKQDCHQPTRRRSRPSLLLRRDLGRSGLQVVAETCRDIGWHGYPPARVHDYAAVVYPHSDRPFPAVGVDNTHLFADRPAVPISLVQRHSCSIPQWSADSRTYAASGYLGCRRGRRRGPPAETDRHDRTPRTYVTQYPKRVGHVRTWRLWRGHHAPWTPTTSARALPCAAGHSGNGYVNSAQEHANRGTTRPPTSASADRRSPGSRTAGSRSCPRTSGSSASSTRSAHPRWTCWSGRPRSPTSAAGGSPTATPCPTGSAPTSVSRPTRRRSAPTNRNSCPDYCRTPTTRGRCAPRSDHPAPPTSNDRWSSDWSGSGGSTRGRPPITSS